MWSTCGGLDEHVREALAPLLRSEGQPVPWTSLPPESIFRHLLDWSGALRRIPNGVGVLLVEWSCWLDGRDEQEIAASARRLETVLVDVACAIRRLRTEGGSPLLIVTTTAGTSRSPVGNLLRHLSVALAELVGDVEGVEVVCVPGPQAEGFRKELLAGAVRILCTTRVSDEPAILVDAGRWETTS